MGDPALIEIEDVKKVYRAGRMEVPALCGVSLRIEEGEFAAIMGASGSGKSTLMNILGCLDRPTSGTYRLDGQLVSKLSPRELADIRNRRVGFVFQSYNLLRRTSAIENVELPLVYAGVSTRERRRRSEEALARVGLADRASHKPNELSGGQQQRVAIARALVSNPRLILADEPTGNLDSHTSVEVMALFQELNRQGMTLLIVTHEPDIAQFVQRVLMMKDGLVVEDRSQQANLARPAPLREASA